MFNKYVKVRKQWQQQKVEVEHWKITAWKPSIIPSGMNKIKAPQWLYYSGEEETYWLTLGFVECIC